MTTYFRVSLSYRQHMAFTALLRDLSFTSRSIVIYVNDLHEEAKMSIGGFAVSDFGEYGSHPKGHRRSSRCAGNEKTSCFWLVVRPSCALLSKL
jgi:hypothetical protein